MNIRKSISILLAGAMAAGLCGCGGKSAGTDHTESTSTEKPAVQAGDPYYDVTGKRVGIVLPSATDERWKRDGAYLEEHLKEKGCEVSAVYLDAYAQEAAAKAESQASENESAQAAADLPDPVKQMVSAGCDLLIMAKDGVVPVAEGISMAGEAGIPVIAYDELIRDTDAISHYVSFDHYAVGQIQGQYVIDALGLSAEKTNKEYHVEFAAGDPSGLDSRYAFSGAYDTLKPLIDSGAVSVLSGQSTLSSVAREGGSEAAEERMKEILSSSYGDGVQLDAVICTDDKVAAGVMKAIASDYKSKHAVLITGMDKGDASFSQVTEGRQSMTVYEALEQEAVVTLDLALTVLAGDRADANLIENSDWTFGCKYDTSSYDNGAGIVPAFLIEPVAVTSGTTGKEAEASGTAGKEAEASGTAGEADKEAEAAAAAEGGDAA